MSTLISMPGFARAAGRAGARIVVSGALAVGLLATAPTLDAHAATPKSSSSASTSTTRTQQSLTPAQRKARAQRLHRHRVAERVGHAMRVARRQKGDRYSYGSAGPNRFDCSGLTYYSFRKVGFRLPRTSSAQAGFARHIRRSRMHVGDLMFFTDGGGVYHVGLFAGWRHGRRLVLHAPHSGARVRTDRVWTDGWFAGTLRAR